MKTLSKFHKVSTSNGSPYFVGFLGGSRVALVPDQDARSGNTETWSLIALQSNGSILGHRSEWLDGGCMLITLAKKPMLSKGAKSWTRVSR